MTGKVKLSLLGGFRLAGPDNHPLTVKLRKSEALLAYLACQGASAITREHTANLLWGDFDQQRARQSLRQAVLDIKKTFGDKEKVPIEMGILCTVHYTQGISTTEIIRRILERSR